MTDTMDVGLAALVADADGTAVLAAVGTMVFGAAALAFLVRGEDGLVYSVDAPTPDAPTPERGVSRLAAAGPEMVDVVDDEERCVGTYERADAARLGFPPRIAAVLVFSTDGNLFLQRRAKGKSNPLACDYSAAGHVRSGEGYLDAARRELQEELGVEAVLRPLAVIRGRDATGKLRKVHSVFTATHDGPFSPDPTEVDGVQEVALGELADAVAAAPEQFTPMCRLVSRVLLR